MGGGAQAGLIGEDTPADAPDDGLTDAYAGQTAGHGGGVEGAHKDSPEGVGDLGEIRNDHDDRRGHIDNGHNGNHQGAHVAQALDAAHQNDEDDDGADHAHHDGNDILLGLRGGDHAADGLVDGAGNGVDLSQVADAKGGKAAEDGKDHRQPGPLLAQAVADVVHGTAHPVAVLVPLTVLDRQGDLTVLGAHAQQGRQPHPEHGAGTSKGNGAGDTGDVAGTDGRRQGCTHGLEGRDGAGLLLRFLQSLAQRVLHDVDEVCKLREAVANSHI